MASRRLQLGLALLLSACSSDDEDPCDEGFQGVLYLSNCSDLRCKVKLGGYLVGDDGTDCTRAPCPILDTRSGRVVGFVEAFRRWGEAYFEDQDYFESLVDACGSSCQVVLPWIYGDGPVKGTHPLLERLTLVRPAGVTCERDPELWVPDSMQGRVGEIVRVPLTFVSHRRPAGIAVSTSHWPRAHPVESFDSAGPFERIHHVDIPFGCFEEGVAELGFNLRSEGAGSFFGRSTLLTCFRTGRPHPGIYIVRGRGTRVTRRIGEGGRVEAKLASATADAIEVQLEAFSEVPGVIKPLSSSDWTIGADNVRFSQIGPVLNVSSSDRPSARIDWLCEDRGRTHISLKARFSWMGNEFEDWLRYLITCE